MYIMITLPHVSINYSIVRSFITLHPIFISYKIFLTLYTLLLSSICLRLTASCLCYIALCTDLLYYLVYAFITSCYACIYFPVFCISLLQLLFFPYYLCLFFITIDCILIVSMIKVAKSIYTRYLDNFFITFIGIWFYYITLWKYLLNCLVYIFIILSRGCINYISSCVHLLRSCIYFQQTVY